MFMGIFVHLSSKNPFVKSDAHKAAYDHMQNAVSMLPKQTKGSIYENVINPFPEAQTFQ